MRHLVIVRGGGELGTAIAHRLHRAGYKVLDQHRTENGRYILTGCKSVPAFKAGNVGEENKWVTLYACMAQQAPLRLSGKAE